MYKQNNKIYFECPFFRCVDMEKSFCSIYSATSVLLSFLPFPDISLP